MDDIVKLPAYDPNNLHPDDEEARKYDTKVDGRSLGGGLILEDIAH